MRDKLGPGTTLSYCTNVFATDSLEALALKITEEVPRIRQHLGIDEPLGLGVCMPPYAYLTCNLGCVGIARHLMPIFRGTDPSGTIPFTGALCESNAQLLTINSFPARPFHSLCVKHLVYDPDWASEDRRSHTYHSESLVPCDSDLQSCSISTLPIGWPSDRDDSARVRKAAENLRVYAEGLANNREEANRIGEPPGPFITLDLEPEPGCILDTASDVIAFFDEHLPDEILRKHIGVCHDVCHAAVMFEDQRDVLRRYAEAGISVNKVQISSALDVDVATLGVETAIRNLKQFAEPRYLHQTGMLHDAADPESFELIEDLPEAIERLESGESPDRIRVHFHVPVYLDAIGPLGTTNNQIAEAVAAAREYHDTKHFEVETYAWGVLPEHLKRETLAEGIADELKWVLKTCGV